MAALKSTASVLASSFEDVSNDKRSNLLKPNSAALQDLVRHFDLSTLDRLWSAALSADQPNWPKEMSDLLHSAELPKKIEANGEPRNGRKSSRGSEGDPRSSVSDYEVEEEMINEESAFLNGASPFPVSFSNQSAVNQMAGQAVSSTQNLIEENLLDNSTCESNDRSTINSTLSFSFNQDSKSGAEEPDDAAGRLRTSGRRKSSSRLARQTGDGPAKKYSCHLCAFVTENKPQYNVHMDKHYEHRCPRCGYGCRTKGRLNRHIRESHPDLADQLGCGDSKRKAKRNLAKPAKPVELADGSMDASDAASDSTILDQNATSLRHSTDRKSLSSPPREPSAAQEKHRNSPAFSGRRTKASKAAAKLDSNEGDRSPSSSDGLMVSADPTNVTRYRKYYCKKCRHVTTSKQESWMHNQVHIAKDKILKCPHCDFTTGFKHHFEYHLRSYHFKSKPYKCIKCNYQCINKSMLSSHLKSHSNVYQYRCNDCAYATKYCHSLKLHLRKYQHKPDKVLNLDGSENPYPIIDVYGTRRGPRPKKGVGSLKLVKQVLEDNDHVVVDKEKVEQIVNTLAEQNPEDGDEKLFRLMMSNEEREARVDQQLNHIIGEQLKTNASNQLTEPADLVNGHPIGANIKQLLSQQAAKNSSKTPNTTSKSSSNSSSGSPALQFAKEKAAAGCSPAVLNRLSNFCKSPKAKPEKNADSTTERQAKAAQSVAFSKQRLLNNLLAAGADSNNNCLMLARSLLNPTLLSGSALHSASLPSALLAETPETAALNPLNPAQLNPLESICNYPAHLLTNQLLHSHLLAQSKSEPHQSKANEPTDATANNFIAQLAFHLALNSQQNIVQHVQQSIQRPAPPPPNVNLSLLLNALSSGQQAEWTEQLSKQLVDQLNPTPNLHSQLLNHLNPNLNPNLNQNLLNPANLLGPNLSLNQNLWNQNLPSSPIRPIAAAPQATASQCSQQATDVLNNLDPSNAKGLTNSMIANWHSYLTGFLFSKAAGGAQNSATANSASKPAPTSLSNVTNASPLTHSLSGSMLSSTLSSTLSSALSASLSGNSAALSNAMSSIVASNNSPSVGQTASSPDNQLSAVQLSSAVCLSDRAVNYRGSLARANGSLETGEKATNCNQRREEASGSVTSKSRPNCAKVENQAARQQPKSNVSSSSTHSSTQSSTQSSLQPSDLSLMLSSIGQVFGASAGKSTSCASSSSSSSNPSCELDLSAILGYSMLMRMQQQFASPAPPAPNKIKQENS